MTRMTRDNRILVLGAGYAGLLCAIRTAKMTRRRGGRVTLVNASDRFTERLRMHQVATGQQLADLRIPEMLEGTGIEFVQGRVTGIDAKAREVALQAGAEVPEETRTEVAGEAGVETPGGTRTLPYDTLVYALGGIADAQGIPGVTEHAFTLDGPWAAEALAARLAEIGPLGGTVTVCGGGLTGVEAAAEIAESHPGVKVVLLGRDVPGARMGERARGYVRGTLERLGVRVRSGIEIGKILPDAVELAGGELVHSDACLWTAGVRVSPLAADAGLEVDGSGRIVVDPGLRSVSHPEVLAVGDAAAIRQGWGEIHGTCQSGIPTAAHAADSVARRLRGKEPKPFRFGYIHQPVSLGRRDAVIQFTRPDDTPRRWVLTGPRAVAYKEFVSASPWKTYRLTKRYAGALMWPHGGRRNRPGRS